MEKFRKLGINDAVLKAIEDENFHQPSEIQEKAIPLILAGKDVIAGSATGSGKTLVFGTGIIHDCEPGKGLQALVLVPTRELAEQVSKALHKFSKHKKLEIAAVYGGVSINPQVENLMTSEVVVGTPGRILDHIDRKTIIFKNLKILVLDEADRMLDMGFIDDVSKIISHCPEKRQTMLFSATISADIAHLAKKWLREPVEVAAESYVDKSKLHQFFYDVDDGVKFSLLVHLLKNEKAGLVMVFCNTRRNTDFVAKNLKHAGIDAMAIHGGLSQNKRTYTMQKFNSEKVYVLVCTDVAARGLDIKNVSHVYNYDIPKDSKEYIHRIGRTARAGKEGKAISIVSKRDYDNFSRVLQDNEDVEIKQEETPFVERVQLVLDRLRRFGSDRGFGNRGRGFEGRGFGARTFDRENRGRGFSSGRSYGGRSREDSRSRGFGRGEIDNRERDRGYKSRASRQSTQRHSGAGYASPGFHERR